MLLYLLIRQNKQSPEDLNSNLTHSTSFSQIINQYRLLQKFYLTDYCTMGR